MPWRFCEVPDHVAVWPLVEGERVEGGGRRGNLRFGVRGGMRV